MSDSYQRRKIVHATAVRLFRENVGCSDGGCVFGHPGGMHTNGGCQHLKTRDHHEQSRTIQMLAAIARELADGSKDAVTKAYDPRLIELLEDARGYIVDVAEWAEEEIRDNVQGDGRDLVQRLDSWIAEMKSKETR
jgi:hypothetical protein